MAGDDDALRGHSEQHGSLQTNAAVRDVIWEWLTSQELPVHRGAVGADEIGVEHPDLLARGEPLVVDAVAASDTLLVRTTLTSLDSARSGKRTLRNLGGGRYRTSIDALPPGLHRLSTTAATGYLPVNSSVLVWEEAP